MKYYEWTVKVRIADTWVADGFDLTAERLHQIMCKELGFASSHEIETEIVTAPKPQDIREEQGYWCPV